MDLWIGNALLLEIIPAAEALFMLALLRQDLITHGMHLLEVDWKTADGESKNKR